MIHIPLRLHYCDAEQRTPLAWLVGASDVTTWMKEWASWHLPQADWKIVPMQGIGALTILTAGQAPPRPTTALAFGRIGTRFYLPSNAVVEPAITAEEIESLIREDVALLIMLPGRRMFSVRPNQILSVSDLLRRPETSTTDWSEAQTGLALNERLLSVLPQDVPGFEDVLSSGQDDIGTQADDLTQLPPRPNEPTNHPLARARRGLGRAVSGITNWVAAHLSSKGQGGAGNAAGAGGSMIQGVMQSLGNWAKRVAQNVTREMLELRHKEILRLLHLLQHNPDDGLKYAISLGGGGAHRGRAAPATRLQAQNVDFNVNALGGGGPADFWQLTWDHRLELERRYRELANRELQLRRYRRAAYIFASLLDDLASAAAALKAGAHWREAAVLYQRLSQPRAAAECLEQGGLLDEAIPIYAALGEDEKVGDLYARLEQHSEAESAWRKAIESAIVQRLDFLTGARVSQKIQNNDSETFAILDRGWMESPQAAACLQMHFRLLGERGRHDDSFKLLRRVSLVSPNSERDVLAAESLANVILTYPDQDFCERVADCVRVLAANHLRNVDPIERRRFVKAIEQLVPGDQLLARDGHRFLAQLRPHPPAVRTRPWNVLAPHPRKIHTFKLPEEIEWNAVVAAGDHFYCAGLSRFTLRLFRGRWTGETQEAHSLSRVAPISESARVAIAAETLDRGLVLLVSTHCDSKTSWNFAPSHVFPEKKRGLLYRADPPSSVKGLCLAHGLAYVFFADKLFTDAVGYRISDGDLSIQRTLRLDEFNEPLALDLLPAYGRPELMVVGLGRKLILFGSESSVKTIDLPQTIEHLAGSAPYSRLRVVAGLTEGAAFFYGPAGDQLASPRLFAQDLIAPHVCLTANGLVVAISETGGEIYNTTSGNLVLKGRMPARGERPFAVLPTGLKSQFAVFSPQGTVTVFET